MKIIKGLIIFPFALIFLSLAFLVFAIRISVEQIWNPEIIGDIMD